MNTRNHDPNRINGLELNSSDKWAVEQRIKESNRKWLLDKIIRGIIGIAIGLFIGKAMCG